LWPVQHLARNKRLEQSVRRRFRQITPDGYTFQSQGTVRRPKRFEDAAGSFDCADVSLLPRPTLDQLRIWIVAHIPGRAGIALAVEIFFMPPVYFIRQN
jgi:hypothetical protein